MEDKNFNDPILVRSKDGFTFPVDVRVAVSVDAKDAPYMVAILAHPDAMVQDGEDKGRICILEARVVLPVVRTLLRNLAEKLTAFEFVDNRSMVEKDMSSAFKEKMKEFKLTTEGAFIGKIDFDHNPQTKALMQTRTDREVAMNQKAMFEEQEKAQRQRSSLTKATEEAEQQRNLVQSEYQVKVKTQEALARAEEAKGEANYIEITFKARQKAYEDLVGVIGKDGTVAMELLKMVGKDKIQICPTVMVNGGNSDSSGVMSALAGTILSRVGKEQK
jgi:regulator of protease activity HflC (stomatin/prohibitin superfamily)